MERKTDSNLGKDVAQNIRFPKTCSLQTDGWMGGRTDTETDRRTGAKTDRWMGRLKDRQVD